MNNKPLLCCACLKKLIAFEKSIKQYQYQLRFSKYVIFEGFISPCKIP